MGPPARARCGGDPDPGENRQDRLVGQRILGQKLRETEIDEFAATTFCPTLPEVAALDAGRIPLTMTNGNAIDDAEQARREYVRDLRQLGLLKVRQGVTSLQEVDACTNE